LIFIDFAHSACPIVFSIALSDPLTRINTIDINISGTTNNELAHSFVYQPDYRNDELKTDALALEWGFGQELKALSAEQQKAKRKSSSLPK